MIAIVTGWRSSIVIVVTICCLGLAGCEVTTSGLIPGMVSVQAERKRGPLPESEWNQLEIWQKVNESPPTHIPTGYSPDAPRTEDLANWYVDERDGKRFVVPDQRVGSYSPGVLRGEATKLTDWEPEYSDVWEDSRVQTC